MVTKKHRLLSVLLCFVLIATMCIFATASNTSAASGDTVYCENAAGWSNVYCYMWKNGSGDNGGWPGQQMTKGEGNLWSYKVTGDWDMIIFNNGSGTQTSDLSYQGNGSCYNNQSGNWTKVDVPADPSTPTTPSNPTPTEPSTPSTPTTPTGKNVVYCKNDAGWGKVNVYMWTDGQGDIQGWPGVAATNIGDGIWMLEYDKDYAKIIFNDGSGTQTSDLAHPGSGQMYNNKTGQWSLYDTKSLHIKGVTADPASPQYTGVSVTLAINAGGGEGTLSYKFTATGAASTVISDYSAANTVTWTPTVAGTYTITYSVKDEAGAEKTQTATYKVNDANTETKPVLQDVIVTPTNSGKTEIVKGKEAVVNITAAGGNTGTKLLFYKVKVTDPSGKTANVPYYTTKSEYKFTPASLGSYQIEVSVQASDNSTVTRSYKYESVSALSAPGELSASVSVSGGTQQGATITATASASGGTAPYTYQFSLNGQVVKAYSSSNSFAFTASSAGEYRVEVSVKDAAGKTATASKVVTIAAAGTPENPSNPGDPAPAGKKGDADLNGSVNVKDATAIQKHVAEITKLTNEGLANAEVDGSGNITVKDATMIQKYVAGMITNW